jgi:hypothetical protein
MKEMEEILSNYHQLPSFNNKTYTFVSSDVKEVVDTNNVLSSYNSDRGVLIDDNKVIINETNEGTYSYNFEKANNKYGVLPIVYIDSASQNLMSVGDIVSDRATLKVNIIEPKIIGHKRDRDNIYAQGEGTLEGAHYGIFDADNKLVQELVTDINGDFTSDPLPVGIYYLRELSPSEGYLIDNNRYDFEIDENHPLQEFNLYEDVITVRLKINKYLFSHNTSLKPEKGAKFAVYDKNDNLYKEAITDAN